MTFGEVLALLLVSFVLFGFLGALAMVTGDLIRNGSMPGTVKATWVVLFLFLPILSVVGYVAVNGSGMADRSAGGNPFDRRRTAVRREAS